jgi:hypothetical protein
LPSQITDAANTTVEAEGRPAVKLSDDPGKFIGPAEEIARYERVFCYRRGEARPV